MILEPCFNNKKIYKKIIIQVKLYKFNIKPKKIYTKNNWKIDNYNNKIYHINSINKK
jgi:hypothetical protein